MSSAVAYMIATFTTPEKIGVTPQSLLWLLPLSAAIVVVYKATKVPKVRALGFIKDSVVLLGSILVFMVIAAMTLLVLSRFVTE
jgi:hypothetical protein